MGNNLPENFEETLYQELLRQIEIMNNPNPYNEDGTPCEVVVDYSGDPYLIRIIENGYKDQRIEPSNSEFLYDSIDNNILNININPYTIDEGPWNKYWYVSPKKLKFLKKENNKLFYKSNDVFQISPYGNLVKVWRGTLIGWCIPTLEDFKEFYSFFDGRLPSEIKLTQIF